jgi:para-nitrobenzyl esterase
MENPRFPIVTLSQGQLAGTLDNGIAVWRGIPYAQPPTGEGRWRAPRPATPWKGVKMADKFGPSPWRSILDSGTPPPIVYARFRRKRFLSWLRR